MAIDAASIKLWSILKQQGLLPKRPAVLEIGQANWYGDVDPKDVPELLPIKSLEGMDLFDIAKAYYRELLNYKHLDTVDAGGPGKHVHRIDLNKPWPDELDRQYDIVINTGTLEHVFDQQYVFRAIHERTRISGLMVHAFPIEGCLDHGFYCYQPNLLLSLASANGYETLAAVRSEVGQDAFLHVAWRKARGGPFVVPQQGKCEGVGGGQFLPVEAEEQNNGRVFFKTAEAVTPQPAQGNEQGLNEVHHNYVSYSLATLKLLKSGQLSLAQVNVNEEDRSFTVMPSTVGTQAGTTATRLTHQDFVAEQHTQEQSNGE